VTFFPRGKIRKILLLESRVFFGELRGKRKQAVE
jgi:hypothetical protein